MKKISLLFIGACWGSISCIHAQTAVSSQKGNSTVATATPTSVEQPKNATTANTVKGQSSVTSEPTEGNKEQSSETPPATQAMPTKNEQVVPVNNNNPR